MKGKLSFISTIVALNVFSQQLTEKLAYSNFIAPEILLGTLSEPNTDFPEVGMQKTLYLTFGKYHNNSNQE